MGDVFARRDDTRTRVERGPGDSLIATVVSGGSWPTDYRVTCHWKGGGQAAVGRYDSNKAAAQGALRAWNSAGHPVVIPPPAG